MKVRLSTKDELTASLADSGSTLNLLISGGTPPCDTSIGSLRHCVRVATVVHKHLSGSLAYRFYNFMLQCHLEH